MGIFSFLKRNKAEQGYPDKSDDYWWNALQKWLNPGVTAAEYACKLAISESVAMLPAVMMGEDEKGKFPAKDEYLYKLLKYSPNNLMSSFDYFESQQNWLLDNGNAYSLLLKNKVGEVRSIIPLDADKVFPEIISGNKLGYVYRNGDEEKRYDSSRILHIRYNTKNGIVGRAPRDCSPETFSFADNLQRHGNRIFEMGGFMAGFIETPQGMKFKDDEQRKNFIASFKGVFGSENYNALGLLENGVAFKPYAGNNKDNQFMEAHNFAILDLARIYRMPPVMIGCTESGMSYASIEQLSILFVQYTIQPWVTRYENAYKSQLFGIESENFLKFNIKGLLRGDLKTQTEALVLQVQHGLKTINEARELNDDNPSLDPLANKMLVSHNLLQGVTQDET